MTEGRILHVSEQAESRLSLTRILAAAGFDVVEAGNDHEALEQLSRTPDLVLLSAPRSPADGAQLARQLRAQPATRQLPVLQLLASADQPRRRGHEADEYLAPPVDAAELVATVRTILQTRRVARSIAHSDVILQNIADAVTAQDPSGKLIYANDAAWRLLGSASQERWRGDQASSLLDGFEMFDASGQPMDPAQLPGRRVLAGEPQARAIICWRRRDDPSDERWVVVQARPVHDAAGAVQMAINILHDISDERRATARLKMLTDASTALSSSLDQATTLACVAGLPLPILGDWSVVHLVEETGLRRIGRHVDPAQQPLLDELLSLPRPGPPVGPSSLTSGQPSLLQEITPESLQARLSADEWQRASALGLRSGMTAPLTARGQTFGALTVLSKRQRHYEPADLQLLQALAYRAALAIDNARVLHEAEQAAALRRDLVAVVAHDLKNPLNAIAMAGSLLLRQAPIGETGDRLRRQSSIISRATGRMNRLIHDLLDVAAIDSGRLELDRQRLALGSLLSEALDLMAPLAQERSITIDRQLDPADEQLELVADRERLLQVLSNLLGNAIKFTEPGGQVTLSGGRGGLGVQIAVRDNGCGIAAEHVPHVFDRYWRLKKQTRAGTGLGLSIVKGILDAHQGEVSVDTEPGRGATFTFTIPIGFSQ